MQLNTTKYENNIPQQTKLNIVSPPRQNDATLCDSSASCITGSPPNAEIKRNAFVMWVDYSCERQHKD